MKISGEAFVKVKWNISTDVEVKETTELIADVLYKATQDNSGLLCFVQDDNVETAKYVVTIANIDVSEP